MPLPDWISRAGDAAGSGLSAVGSGLGAALPYALPAALGAGMGALSGQGAGATALGALAGGLSAKGVQSEEEVKQQALHLEAQKADIEIQKGRLALADDKEKDEYAQKNITPELAKMTGMSVDTLRRMYKDKPEDYFQTIGMANWVNTMSKDPKFKAMSPQVAAALPNMPPEIAARVLGKMLDKTYSGKTEPVKDPKTGKWSFDIYDTSNPADRVTMPLSGDPQQLVIKETAPSTTMSDAKMQLSIKGWVGSNKPPNAAEDLLARKTGMGETKADWDERLKTYIGTITPDDASEGTVDKYAKPWLASAAGTSAAPPPPPTMSDADRKLLQASLPKDPPPKKFWNQDRVMNGVRVHIDDKGAVTVLGKAS